MAYEIKGDANVQRQVSALVLRLRGLAAGAVKIKSADTTAEYTLTLPTAQGAAGEVLTNDGSGNLSWSPVAPPDKPVDIITSSTSLTHSHSTLICKNATPISLILPLASASTDWAFRVKKAGAGSVTILPSGTDTIDGAGSFALEWPLSSFDFVCDGTGWNRLGGSGTNGMGPVLFVRDILLTFTHIDEGGLTLDHTPIGEVQFDVVGAPTQRRDIDYVITGSNISWAGKALEGILEENDVVRVTYTAIA